MSIQRAYYFQRPPPMYQNSLATNNRHPRELYIAKAAENCGFSLVVPIISRTPTRLISPLRMFQNCGSSSIDVFLINCPMPVFFVPSGSILLPMILGSKSILNIILFCAMSSFFRSSASMYILLNLYILNFLPFLPIRSCAKKIGPGDAI